jgi:hypothetical protein
VKARKLKNRWLREFNLSENRYWRRSYQNPGKHDWAIESLPHRKEARRVRTRAVLKRLYPPGELPRSFYSSFPTLGRIRDGQEKAAG